MGGGGGGLIMGGAYIRKEICVSKSAGLIIGGNLCRQFLHVHIITLGH